LTIGFDSASLRIPTSTAALKFFGPDATSIILHYNVHLMRNPFLMTTIVLLCTTAAAQPSALQTRAKQALAITNGRLHFSGLQQSVTVLRDRWGVAHIYAQNQHDLFFAQGVVASQDRLFQMELWKRAGQGRLAEILGPSALLRDINARLLRYRGDMQAEFASYSPDTKEILDAFTSGINAYIASLNAPGSPGLPIEFQLAGMTPEPWKPEDCLNRMAAYAMTGNADSELRNADLVETLGTVKAVSLIDLDPAIALDPAPGADFAGLSPSLLQYLVGSDSRIDFPPRALQESNNWTVSGALTQSGKPLLANDPHRVIAEPSLRYMVHLVAPGWNVIGAGEPGLPGVALGHNEHIAWGFTIFGLDQQDLYLEELNPANPLQYKTERGWQDLRVERETFAILGGPPVHVDLKFTRHGPVLWENGNRALTLHWVGSEPGTAGYLGSLAVDRAQNWDQFESAMPRWKVPSENIVYADVDGNIGEHSVGLAPHRNWTGLLPVPGSGNYEWSGFVPTSELPHFFNPKAGFVATANHRMIPDDYRYKVGYEWAPQYRVSRITQVLSSARDAGTKLTIDDMERLQNDVFSMPADELIGLLRAAAGNHPDSNAQLLLQWNAKLDRDSGAAALYELWLQQLTSSVTKKVAPASVWPLIANFEPPLVLRHLSHPTEEVFGPSPETVRDHLLLETLQSAAAILAKIEGADAKQWSWGKLHTVSFRHPLDHTPGAAALFDLGPLPRPGDEYVVNATGSEGDDFAQTSGASYREILDTSNWDRSVAINTPGQSGQPGSPHYADLLPLWYAGQYFPLAYSREAVEKIAIEKLALQP
jgi:penicillin amidase